MKKFKEIIFSALSIFGLIFLFLRGRNQKNLVSKETVIKSNKLENDAKILFDEAEFLDNKAKSLDNIVIEGDEEWHKK